MPRLILLFLLVLLAVAAAWKLIVFLRTREWDWTGIAFAVGFVILAFWLRDITGMGD